jgi:4-hydroxy-3-methylbut-2-enyl diphosphate reductase
MNIIKARVLGFCMGVRRAVDFALAEANKADDIPVYTLGPLIHNPKVLADLKIKGVNVLDTVYELNQKNESCAVIIRAHGINPRTEKDLYDRGVRIVDATCPNVKASQLKAQELSREGYCLFLAGEAAHAEIEGIIGYANSTSSGSDAPFCVVVGTADEARKEAFNLYKIKNNAKTALLGQTTISEKEYKKIGAEIYNYFPNLEIEQTICAATSERQEALKDLLTKVDAVIIVGGKESANTRRLLAIAKESGKPCLLAESAADIPKEFFNYGVVGISAGASTPDSVIDEIEKVLLG